MTIILIYLAACIPSTFIIAACMGHWEPEMTITIAFTGLIFLHASTWAAVIALWLRMDNFDAAERRARIG